MLTEPIRKPLLRDQVYELILGAIAQGNILPGDRIVESSLAKNLQVSQAPVREALQRLAAEGIVITLAHSGTFVRSMRSEDMRDVYEVREALESLAARRALTRGVAQEDLETLERLVDEALEAAEREDLATLVQLDLSFHREIFRMSGNETLENAARPLFAQIGAFTSVTNLVYFENLTEIAEAHRPIIEALRSNDPDRVTEEIQQHARVVWERADARAAHLPKDEDPGPQQRAR